MVVPSKSVVRHHAELMKDAPRGSPMVFLEDPLSMIKPDEPFQ